MKTAMELKKEMSSLSMVDEFAKYAKIQRRLNQVNLDLEATGKSTRILGSPDMTSKCPTSVHSCFSWHCLSDCLFGCSSCIFPLYNVREVVI